MGVAISGSGCYSQMIFNKGEIFDVMGTCRENYKLRLTMEKDLKDLNQ